MSASLERSLRDRIFPPQTALPLQRAKLAGLAIAVAAVVMLVTYAGATPAYAAASLQNAGLEVDANSNSVPDCWQKGGYGTNLFSFTRTSDAHTGLWAERVRITSLSSGDRKLVSAQDSGTCAPSVTAGQSYRLSAWYKSDIATRFVVYLRSSSGGWSYWTSGSSLPASSTWTQASWTTPPVPSGQTMLSFGLNLTRAGSLTTDDYGFANATSSTTTSSGSTTPTDTTPPDTTITTQPADPTTATDASFAFTSTEANSTFRCTLDGSAAACASPKTFTGLAVGPHSFRVAATDAAGNADQTPATFNWNVQTPAVSTPTATPSPTPTATPTSSTTPDSSTRQSFNTTVPGVSGQQNPMFPRPISYCSASIALDAWEPASHGNTQYDKPRDDLGTMGWGDGASPFAWWSSESAWISRRAQIDDHYSNGDAGHAMTTTEAFEFAACRWGIRSDLLRAVAVQESDWHQTTVGDTCASPNTVATGHGSFSIIQIKNLNCSDEGDWGGWPRSANSVFFALDAYGASFRNCLEDGISWYSTPSGDSDATRERGCVGAWFSGSYAPNSSYTNSVYQWLSQRTWKSYS